MYIFKSMTRWGKQSVIQKNILNAQYVFLKVVSAILVRNINYHINLIFPRDPLAAKKNVCL